MDHDGPVERFIKILPNQGHKTKKCLKDWIHSLQAMTLTFRIVVGNLMITCQQWVGDTMVFKLKWLLKVIMRLGYTVLYIHIQLHKQQLNSVKHPWNVLTSLNQSMCFFTVSTNRYEMFTDSLKTVESSRISVPKRVSTTRWSRRSDAVKVLSPKLWSTC